MKKLLHTILFFSCIFFTVEVKIDDGYLWLLEIWIDRVLDFIYCCWLSLYI